MLPIQPPLVPDYFVGNCNDLNSQQKFQLKTHYRSFFLSWEDALWHLLKINKIKKNAIILVPEFFCGDVIDNMNAHGLKHIVYKLDKYLQPDLLDFVLKLQEKNPAVVVIFHSVGISNSLLKNHERWFKFLPKETLLIEDCVHRVIDENQIQFITKNHYVIDSLRKVVPIQGSWVYSAHSIPKISTKINFLTAWYRLQVFLWWVLMQFFLILVYYTKNKTIQKYGNICAEFAMKNGYNVIGNEHLPACGITGMTWLSNKLNRTKIYTVKHKQTELYIDQLQSIKNSKFFFQIPISEADYSQLRGFPLGIELQSADNFLKYMRKNDVLLRFELNDSDWCTKQKIVYLPMGLHVRTSDICAVCKLVRHFKI